MGADGTFVIAWFHKTGSGYIIKSATRIAASSTWTPETRLSGEYAPIGMEAPLLAVSQDGTAAAVWKRADSGTLKYATFANVRDAGGIWASAETQLSGGMDYTGISDLTVLPDGRIFALWNGRLPGGESVLIAQRTKTGGWDTESVSGFINDVNGSALAGIYNDNVLVVWVEGDSLLPPLEANSVHTGSCSFSPYSCSPSSVLADGYKIAALGYNSVNFTTIRPSASVAWFGARDTDDPLFPTHFGMFYSQWPRPFSWAPFIPSITGAGS